MDEKPLQLYVTNIAIYSHPLLDEDMVLGDCRLFQDLDVPYRQIGSGFRAASSETVFRCIAPHWHMMVTAYQDEALTLYTVDGKLAIKWESVVSGVLDVILKLIPGDMREVDLRQVNAVVLDLLGPEERVMMLNRMKAAFLTKLLDDIGEDDH